MTDTEQLPVDTRLSPLAAEAADMPRAEQEAALRPSGDRYLNRELSWLDFNARVLAQAEDPESPLLERAKFLAIFANNLDEFFQVRVAGLKDQVAAGLAIPSPDGRTPNEQLDEVRNAVVDLVERHVTAYRDLAKGLAAHGIEVVQIDDVTEAQRAELNGVFEDRIFPVLTPLAVDPSHPFPYISNLSLNLAVIVADPHTGQRRFARVKVPPLLPRFVAVQEHQASTDGADGGKAEPAARSTFVPLEQLIAAHLPRLFHGMEVLEHHVFRVTRNADLTLEDEEADDLLALVEIELRRRRFGRAVRVEVEPSMTGEVRELLVRELELHPDDLFDVPGPLDLSGLWALYALDRRDLKDPPHSPATPRRLKPPDDDPLDIFEVIRERDVLVHHPYESFTASVEAFIKQAATDPHVLAIKQTLYRTSSDSPIVKSLIRAAERGKQVAALVELKARFDEQANVAWARALEEAGVHVVYGLVGLKTHSKTALVVRQEPDGIRRYVHIGTGNYNSNTAKLYEDLGLLSSDPDLGADLTDLFNLLTGYSRQTRYRKILLAPTSLRNRIVELVGEEAEAARRGGRGRIVLKMNSLVDPKVIDALYKASEAGADVDLIVRGICCLRPGVPGLSEHIRVKSLVGRFLEHSRIYAFGDGEERPVRYLIGSADMMPRNLDRRVEVCVQVDDRHARERLAEVLEANLQDDRLSWTLRPDGRWERVEPADPEQLCNAHVFLAEQAQKRARRRREEEVAAAPLRTHR
jgi:polyphosphate kinase